MTGESALKASGVYFSYGSQPVLTDVNMEIFAGDFLALIGPNGGGKTTLMKLFMGLLTPDRGEIRIFGKSPREALGRFSYVPQVKTNEYDFPVLVKEVVLMGRLSSSLFSSRYSKADLEKTDEMLSLFEIKDVANRKIGELSGGQRQRAFIARALAAEPDLLMLDEPSSGIDSEGQVKLYEILKKLNEKMTIVLISHDVGVIQKYIKSVACVNKRFFFHGDSSISPEMLEKVYHCPVALLTHGHDLRILKGHMDELEKNHEHSGI
ncbi:MAG: ABC transporter ATP-binding protein [Candidatus Wallbacteria bacterium]|nr:ABC transporter ATP-binding protein [Candidatus Wallbacteria bacterium]